jgi:hypothetical protein
MWQLLNFVLDRSRQPLSDLLIFQRRQVWFHNQPYLWRLLHTTRVQLEFNLDYPKILGQIILNKEVSFYFDWVHFADTGWLTILHQINGLILLGNVCNQFDRFDFDRTSKFRVNFELQFVKDI